MLTFVLPMHMYVHTHVHMYTWKDTQNFLRIYYGSDM